MADEPTVTEYRLYMAARHALGFLMSKARKDPNEREVVYELKDAVEGYERKYEGE